MNALSAALLTRRSLRHEIFFSLGAIVVATLLRQALDGVLPPGFPFLTFFPAVMLTLVFSSIRSGIVVAVVCGFISWFWFIAPSGQFSLSGGALLAIGFYVLITTTDILFITAAVWALEELTKSRERASNLAHARALMFSELQHRISNNLQTVAALLRLQSAQTKDEEARRAMNASQSRIRSISRLQRRLHSPDLQTLDAADYLREVLQDTLEVASEGKVAMNFTADHLELPNEAAIPLGLIAGELMMNAIEHGLANADSARVDVSLQVGATDEAGMTPAVLELRDSGPGLPPDFELDSADSLGLTISRQFAMVLNGDLDLSNGPNGGVVARLRFAVAPADSVRFLDDADTPAPEPCAKSA
ncbi:histidine kinase dimerization/phosphoacceptor domain -containing protein [Pararhodobacter sp. SW119]|uniref:sensor histidine kinase n=1 Tax=Pararhodobacter sp. SW119 TaxID=2780075 RepID=UPI001ADFCECB|nr:histidine kinase dimerization/phosphoacceptor domain -containing protein [Pararhodobacter sp. SW119]